ncbi:MAG: hypothetical protein JW839_17235 [Candidatus Lokiarchaeota archaeon]|nr:hypothetical protein [Candidatus Lokiarchaeota archaeon]
MAGKFSKTGTTAQAAIEHLFGQMTPWYSYEASFAFTLTTPFSGGALYIAPLKVPSLDAPFMMKFDGTTLSTRTGDNTYSPLFTPVTGREYHVTITVLSGTEYIITAIDSTTSVETTYKAGSVPFTTKAGTTLYNCTSFKLVAEAAATGEIILDAIDVTTIDPAVEFDDTSEELVDEDSEVVGGFPTNDGTEVDIIVDGEIEQTITVFVEDDATAWKDFVVPLDTFSSVIAREDDWIYGKRWQANPTTGIPELVSYPIDIQVAFKDIADYSDKEIYLDIHLVDSTMRAGSSKDYWTWITEFPANTALATNMYNGDTGDNGSFVMNLKEAGQTVTFTSLDTQITAQGQSPDVNRETVTTGLWVPHQEYGGVEVVDGSGAAVFGTDPVTGCPWTSDDVATRMAFTAVQFVIVDALVVAHSSLDVADDFAPHNTTITFKNVFRNADGTPTSILPRVYLSASGSAERVMAGWQFANASWQDGARAGTYTTVSGIAETVHQSIVMQTRADVASTTSTDETNGLAVSYPGLYLPYRAYLSGSFIATSAPNQDFVASIEIKSAALPSKRYTWSLTVNPTAGTTNYQQVIPFAIDVLSSPASAGTWTYAAPGGGSPADLEGTSVDISFTWRPVGTCTSVARAHWMVPKMTGWENVVFVSTGLSTSMKQKVWSNSFMNLYCNDIMDNMGLQRYDGYQTTTFANDLKFTVSGPIASVLNVMNYRADDPFLTGGSWPAILGAFGETGDPPAGEQDQTWYEIPRATTDINGDGVVDDRDADDLFLRFKFQEHIRSRTEPSITKGVIKTYQQVADGDGSSILVEKPAFERRITAVITPAVYTQHSSYLDLATATSGTASTIARSFAASLTLNTAVGPDKDVVDSVYLTYRKPVGLKDIVVDDWNELVQVYDPSSEASQTWLSNQGYDYANFDEYCFKPVYDVVDWRVAAGSSYAISKDYLTSAGLAILYPKTGQSSFDSEDVEWITTKEPAGQVLGTMQTSIDGIRLATHVPEIDPLQKVRVTVLKNVARSPPRASTVDLTESMPVYYVPDPTQVLGQSTFTAGQWKSGFLPMSIANMFPAGDVGHYERPAVVVDVPSMTFGSFDGLHDMWFSVYDTNGVREWKIRIGGDGTTSQAGNLYEISVGFGWQDAETLTRDIMEKILACPDFLSSGIQANQVGKTRIELTWDGPVGGNPARNPLAGSWWPNNKLHPAYNELAEGAGDGAVDEDDGWYGFTVVLEGYSDAALTTRANITFGRGRSTVQSGDGFCVNMTDTSAPSRIEDFLTGGNIDVDVYEGKIDPDRDIMMDLGIARPEATMSATMSFTEQIAKHINPSLTGSIDWSAYKLFGYRAVAMGNVSNIQSITATFKDATGTAVGSPFVDQFGSGGMLDAVHPLAIPAGTNLGSITFTVTWKEKAAVNNMTAVVGIAGVFLEHESNAATMSLQVASGTPPSIPVPIAPFDAAHGYATLSWAGVKAGTVQFSGGFTGLQIAMPASSSTSLELRSVQIMRQNLTSGSVLRNWFSSSFDTQANTFQNLAYQLGSPGSFPADTSAWTTAGFTPSPGRDDWIATRFFDLDYSGTYDSVIQYTDSGGDAIIDAGGNILLDGWNDVIAYDMSGDGIFEARVVQGRSAKPYVLDGMVALRNVTYIDTSIDQDEDGLLDWKHSEFTIATSKTMVANLSRYWVPGSGATGTWVPGKWETTLPSFARSRITRGYSDAYELDGDGSLDDYIEEHLDLWDDAPRPDLINANTSAMNDAQLKEHAVLADHVSADIAANGLWTYETHRVTRRAGGIASTDETCDLEARRTFLLLGVDGEKEITADVLIIESTDVLLDPRLTVFPDARVGQGTIYFYDSNGDGVRDIGFVFTTETYWGEMAFYEDADGAFVHLPKAIGFFIDDGSGKLEVTPDTRDQFFPTYWMADAPYSKLEYITGLAYETAQRWFVEQFDAAFWAMWVAELAVGIGIMVFSAWAGAAAGAAIGSAGGPWGTLIGALVGFAISTACFIIWGAVRSGIQTYFDSTKEAGGELLRTDSGTGESPYVYGSSVASGYDDLVSSAPGSGSKAFAVPFKLPFYQFVDYNTRYIPSRLFVSDPGWVEDKAYYDNFGKSSGSIAWRHGVFDAFHDGIYPLRIRPLQKYGWYDSSDCYWFEPLDSYIESIEAINGDGLHGAGESFSLRIKVRCNTVGYDITGGSTVGLVYDQLTIALAVEDLPGVSATSTITTITPGASSYVTLTVSIAATSPVTIDTRSLTARMRSTTEDAEAYAMHSTSGLATNLVPTIDGLGNIGFSFQRYGLVDFSNHGRPAAFVPGTTTTTIEFTTRAAISTGDYIMLHGSSGEAWCAWFDTGTPVDALPPSGVDADRFIKVAIDPSATITGTESAYLATRVRDVLAANATFTDTSGIAFVTDSWLSGNLVLEQREVVPNVEVSDITAMTAYTRQDAPAIASHEITDTDPANHLFYEISCMSGRYESILNEAMEAKQAEVQNWMYALSAVQVVITVLASKGILTGISVAGTPLAQWYGSGIKGFLKGVVDVTKEVFEELILEEGTSQLLDDVCADWLAESLGEAIWFGVSTVENFGDYRARARTYQEFDAMHKRIDQELVKAEAERDQLLEKQRTVIDTATNTRYTMNPTCRLSTHVDGIQAGIAADLRRVDGVIKQITAARDQVKAFFDVLRGKVAAADANIKAPNPEFQKWTAEQFPGLDMKQDSVVQMVALTMFEIVRTAAITNPTLTMEEILEQQWVKDAFRVSKDAFINIAVRLKDGTVWGWDAIRQMRASEFLALRGDAVVSDPDCALCGAKFNQANQKTMMKRFSDHIIKVHKVSIVTDSAGHAVFSINNQLRSQLSSADLRIMRNMGAASTEFVNQVGPALAAMATVDPNIESFSELKSHHPLNSLNRILDLTYSQFRDLPAFKELTNNPPDSEVAAKFAKWKAKIRENANSEDLVIEFVSLFYQLYDMCRITVLSKNSDPRIVKVAKEILDNYPGTTRERNQEAEERNNVFMGTAPLMTNFMKAVGFLMAMQRSAATYKNLRDLMLDIVKNFNHAFDTPGSPSQTAFVAQQVAFTKAINDIFVPSSETSAKGGFHEGSQGLEDFQEFVYGQGGGKWAYLNQFRKLALEGKIPFFSGRSDMSWQHEGKRSFHNLDNIFILLEDPNSKIIPPGFMKQDITWLGPFVIVDDKANDVLEPATIISEDGSMQYKDYRKDFERTVQRYLYDGVGVNPRFRTIALTVPEGLDISSFKEYMKQKYAGIQFVARNGNERTNVIQLRQIVLIAYTKTQNSEIVELLYKAAMGETINVQEKGKIYSWTPLAGATIDDLAAFLASVAQDQKLGGRFGVKPEGHYDAYDYSRFISSNYYSLGRSTGETDASILANPIINGKPNPAWDDMPSRMQFLAFGMQAESGEHIDGSITLSRLVETYGNSLENWISNIQAVNTINQVWQLMFTEHWHGLTAGETLAHGEDWTWGFANAMNPNAERPELSPSEQVTWKASGIPAMVRNLCYPNMRLENINEMRLFIGEGERGCVTFFDINRFGPTIKIAFNTIDGTYRVQFSGSDRIPDIYQNKIVDYSAKSPAEIKAILMRIFGDPLGLLKPLSIANDLEGFSLRVGTNSEGKTAMLFTVSDDAFIPLGLRGREIDIDSVAGALQVRQLVNTLAMIVDLTEYKATCRKFTDSGVQPGGSGFMFGKDYTGIDGLFSGIGISALVSLFDGYASFTRHTSIIETADDYRTDLTINFKQFVADRLKIAIGDARLTNILDSLQYRVIVNKASGLTIIYEQGAGGVWSRLGEFASVFQVTDAMVQFFKHLTHYNKQRFAVTALTTSEGRMSFTLSLLNEAGVPTGHVVSGQLNCITGRYSFSSITKAGSIAMQLEYQEAENYVEEVHLQRLREFIEGFVIPASDAGLTIPGIATVTAKRNGIIVSILSINPSVGYVKIEYRFGSEKPFFDVVSRKCYATFDELLEKANLK